MRRLVILVGMLIAGADSTANAAGESGIPLPAGPEQGAAGAEELAALDAQLVELGRALAVADDERARLCTDLGWWCLDRLHDSVDQWEPPRLPPDPPMSDLGALYAERLRARLGFDPLGETPLENRAWRARERAVATAEGAVDALRASRDRLARLVERLRRQLGLPPDGTR